MSISHCVEFTSEQIVEDLILFLQENGSNIESLRLIGCPPSMITAFRLSDQLVTSLNKQKLKSLEIDGSGHPFWFYGLTDLLENNFITHLSLYNFDEEITLNQVIKLVSGLSVNQSLKYLNLQRWGLSEIALDILMLALTKHSTIKTLHLFNLSSLSERSVSYLIKHNQTVESLAICSTPIGDHSLLPLNDNTTITNLMVSGDGISLPGLEEALKNNQALKTLRLLEFTAIDIRSFAAALSEHPKLEQVYLQDSSHNGSDLAETAIQIIKRCRNLKFISLIDINFDGRSEKIAQLINQSNLTSLNFYPYKKDIGIKFLEDVIRHNTKLKQLSIDNFYPLTTPLSIDEEEWKSLTEAFRANKQLREIKFEYSRSDVPDRLKFLSSEEGLIYRRRNETLQQKIFRIIQEQSLETSGIPKIILEQMD